MKKSTLITCTDVVIAALSLGLIFTGVIMKWVLPPGMGGGGGRLGGGGGHGFGAERRPIAMLLGYTRHDWGDVHFWIAAAIVAGVLLHLLLHWGWIKSTTKKAVRAILPARAIREGSGVPAASQ